MRFSGLEHAMELVADVDGVRFVNDSKATNVESALRSIESFERGLVAIIGGRFKGGDMRSVASAARVRAPKRSSRSAKRRRWCARRWRRRRCSRGGVVREAVDDGVRAGEAGGVVLLAPACASFDMFRDYAERGRRFKEEVTRIAEDGGPQARARI